MQGSWILILAIATSSLLLLAISVFFVVRCVWKWKQDSKVREERKRKLGCTSGQLNMPDFQIPDAVPLLFRCLVQTTQEEEEQNKRDVVQPLSLYRYNNIGGKAVSLFDLDRVDNTPPCPDTAGSLSEPRGDRMRSTGSLAAEEVNDVIAVQRPHSYSQSIIPAEYNGRPGHHKRPSRLSVVDMTVPQGQVARQRSYSQEDLTKIENHAELTGEFKSSQKRSRIVFGVFHNEEEHTLIVHVINAMDLPLKNNYLLDSFVRLSLRCTVKRKTQAKYQSKIIKKSCNPIYNEIFQFYPVHLEEIPMTSLKIKVFHHRESFSRNELVGETLVSVSDPEVLGREGVIRYLVPKCLKRQSVGGEVMLSVCHHATSAQLKVSVIKMRNVPKQSKATFVTVKLHYKDQVLHTEEAKPKKSRNSGTAYNDLFMFDVHTSTSCTLENFSLTFTAYYRDFLRNKEVIGCVKLSDDAPAELERTHWKRVRSSPLKAIAEWHKLHEIP